MKPWMDGIDKLRLLGYSINLESGKLRYSYHGKSNPSSDEIVPLLEVLKTHKANILQDPAFLIEQTLLEINRGYPEVRNRVKDTPQWKALSEIERDINKAALEDDFEGLDKALQAYKQAVLTVEGTGSQGNLFQAHRTMQGEPGSVGHENSQDDPGKG